MDLGLTGRSAIVVNNLPPGWFATERTQYLNETRARASYITGQTFLCDGGLVAAP